MKTLLHISKYSIVLILVVGFIKFIIIDQFFSDNAYYAETLNVFWFTIVLLTISTFGALAIWLVCILLNKIKD